MASKNFHGSSSQSVMAEICLFESPSWVTSLQISMERALELPENLFKALIFWFFLIKQKEHIDLGET
jgi:hypothetical protein